MTSRCVQACDRLCRNFWPSRNRSKLRSQKFVQNSSTLFFLKSNFEIVRLQTSRHAHDVRRQETIWGAANIEPLQRTEKFAGFWNTIWKLPGIHLSVWISHAEKIFTLSSTPPSTSPERVSGRVAEGNGLRLGRQFFYPPPNAETMKDAVKKPVKNMYINTRYTLKCLHNFAVPSLRFFWEIMKAYNQT